MFKKKSFTIDEPAAVLTVEEWQAKFDESQKTAADYLRLADLAEKQVEETQNALRIVTEERNDIEQELTAANSNLAQAKSYIGELEERLTKEIKSNPSRKETFELGGKKFEISGGAHIPGIGKRTALEIATDPDAQEYLVSKGSGVIKEIK